MSYAQRQINLQFQNKSGTLDLSGLQVSAIVDMPGGTQASGSLQMHVFGMALEQMNNFSSVGSQFVALADENVTVLAGDVGEPLTNVFEGNIFRAFMDFSAIPEVSFVVAARAGLYHHAAPAAPNTYKGSHNAEDIIQALAQSIGFMFVNDGGAHAVLRDQYVYGSVIQQIKTVAGAAGFPVEIAHNTITIWPNEGVRDEVIIDVNENTGLVGYPTYYPSGFIVKTLFNPLIEMGRRINLKSTIPKANGIWHVQTVTHELYTQQQDGPWFTTTRLSPPPYVAKN